MKARWRNLTVAEIQKALMRGWRLNLTLPNYTPAGWFECDVATVKDGQWHEYEIKLSVSDFLADGEKERGGRMALVGGEWKQVGVERKHDLLASGDSSGPAYFWYATPQGLLRASDLPAWAGLVELSKRGSTVLATTIRPAPRLHSEPVDAALTEHMKAVCHQRMHALLRGVDVEAPNSSPLAGTVWEGR